MHLRYLSYRFTPIVPSPVLTQVWRDGTRRARLARAVRGCLIEPTSATLAKKAGVLLGRAGQYDAVDAIVVASAIAHETLIATSDPDDLRALWEVAETGQVPPLLIF
ncbi:MAG: twitching motility protein PilT [Egibacteraceae bacterium]